MRIIDQLPLLQHTRNIMTRIEYPVPAGVSSTHLPFSPATKVGNLLFVSGQASTDETGAIVSGTFEEEFRRTMDNLLRILRACGTDLTRLAQVKAYVKNAGDWEQYNALYREYFKPPYP